MKSFGAFIRRVRKEKGFTQDFVAEKLGVVTPVLSKWENDKGAPSLSMLCRLCNVLSISIEDCIANEKTSETKLPPDSFNAEILGDTIKKLRIKNGWSQAETGNKLFVTSQTVSKWEKGGVSSLQVLEQLSRIFAVTPTTLLCGIDDSFSIENPVQADGLSVNSLQTDALPTKSRKKRSLIIKCCAIAISAAIILSAGGWGIYAAVKSTADDDHTASEDTSGGLADDNTDAIADDNTGEIADDNTGGDSESQVITYCLPLDNACVYKKQEFGYNMSTQSYEMHGGVDFKAEEGATVYAVAGGTVSVIRNEILYTEIYIIGTDGVKYIYAGISPAEGLAVGSTVKSGDAIASISTPYIYEYREGFHLHFEMWSGDNPIDPLEYLPEVEIITLS